MYKKYHECMDCDAAYRIKHDLDDLYYTVKFCPFCGSENDDEINSYEEEDE